MKITKKLIGLSLIAFSMVALPAAAQNPQTSACSSPTEKCISKDKKTGDRQKRQRIDRYAGLNLTDAQKTSLTRLDSTSRAARRTEKTESRKKYLEEVKAIVGPDQYVVFLENMYVNSPSAGNHQKFMKKGTKDNKAKKDYARHDRNKDNSRDRK